MPAGNALVRVKKTARILTPYLLFGLFLLIVLKFQSAQAAGYLGDGWDKYLGGLKRFNDTQKPGEDLAIAFVQNLIRIVRYIIGAVAAFTAILYGVYMVTARGKEDVVQKQRENLTWLVVGFIVLMLAENVALLLNPQGAESGKLINFEAANDQLRSIVNYLKYLFGFVLLIIMMASGVTMVTAGGDEEKITKQKEIMGYAGLGALILMLADEIVKAVYVVNAPGSYSVGNTTETISEITNIIRLILAFLGPAAIIMTIVAGFYWLTSMSNEDRTKKAKGFVVGGITGIIIVYTASAIVNTVIHSSLNP